MTTLTSSSEVVLAIVATLELHKVRQDRSGYFHCVCGDSYVSQAGFNHHIGWAFVDLLDGARKASQ